MVTYGTKLHAYTETEFSFSLLWDSDASSFSFLALFSVLFPSFSPLSSSLLFSPWGIPPMARSGGGGVCFQYLLCVPTDLFCCAENR